MTWQEIKGKGDDEIRSLAAQDFNDLVPVMVEMGIGEQGLRKRPSPTWGPRSWLLRLMQTPFPVCINRRQG